MRELTPIRVVQIVGALPFVGNRWRNDAMGARRLAAVAAGTRGIPAVDEGRLQTQGGLAETGAEQHDVQSVEFHGWTRSMQSATDVTLRRPQL